MKKMLDLNDVFDSKTPFKTFWKMQWKRLQFFLLFSVDTGIILILILYLLLYRY